MPFYQILTIINIFQCILSHSVYLSTYFIENTSGSTYCLLHPGFLHDLFSDPEEGGDMFLWNVSWLSMDYMVSYSRRYTALHNHCCDDLKFYTERNWLFFVRQIFVYFKYCKGFWNIAMLLTFFRFWINSVNLHKDCWRMSFTCIVKQKGLKSD
jgi:hypothetical protein